MYRLIIKPDVYKIFAKLAKKDKVQARRIGKNIYKIRENPSLGKPLRAPMEGLRRVQVGSFVLVYEVDDVEEIVTILDYDYHDKVY